MFVDHVFQPLHYESLCILCYVICFILFERRKTTSKSVQLLFDIWNIVNSLYIVTVYVISRKSVRSHTTTLELRGLLLVSVSFRFNSKSSLKLFETYIIPPSSSGRKRLGRNDLVNVFDRTKLKRFSRYIFRTSQSSDPGKIIYIFVLQSNVTFVYSDVGHFPSPSGPISECSHVSPTVPKTFPGRLPYKDRTRKTPGRR